MTARTSRPSARAAMPASWPSRRRGREKGDSARARRACSSDMKRLRREEISSRLLQPYEPPYASPATSSQIPGPVWEKHPAGREPCRAGTHLPVGAFLGVNGGHIGVAGAGGCPGRCQLIQQVELVLAELHIHRAKVLAQPFALLGPRDWDNMLALRQQP